MSLDADIGVKFCVVKDDGIREVAIDTTIDAFNVEFSAVLSDMTLKAKVIKTSFQDMKMVSPVLETFVSSKVL